MEIDNNLEPGPCFRTGTFKDRKQMIDPECIEQHGQPEAASHKLDVDGDGRVDELLKYANQLVLVLNTARGFTPLLLIRGMDTGHHDAEVDWLASIRAGGAVYLASSYHEVTSFDDTEPEYVSAHTVYRVRPDGKVFEVFSETSDLGDVHREFRGNPDGSLVISDGKSRKQTLRWDASLFRFVP